MVINLNFIFKKIKVSHILHYNTEFVTIKSHISAQNHSRIFVQGYDYMRKYLYQAENDNAIAKSK